MLKCLIALVIACAMPGVAAAQTPPTSADVQGYTGLLAAAHKGDVPEITRLLAAKADPNVRDSWGRTPLQIAAYGSHYDAVRALKAGGGDIRAFDRQRYDVITIAAVKDDASMLRLAIELGGDPRATTSPYDGTALIAAAHLGHDEVVRTLLDAGAPVDHVNNLGWTALIEAIILGQGGPRHTECVRAILAAKANPNIADRQGQTPLNLAKSRDYREMIALISAAGGK